MRLPFCSSLGGLFLLAASSYSLFPANKCRIGILEPSTRSGVAPSVAKNIRGWVSEELSKINRFEVIDSASSGEFSAAYPSGAVGRQEGQSAKRTGRIKVQKMVIGSVSMNHSQFIVTLSLMDVERSRIEGFEKAVAINANEIEEEVRSLARKLAKVASMSGRIVTVFPSGTYSIDLGGDDGVVVGARIGVIREGAGVIDQTTGEVLGRKIDDLGKAMIIRLVEGGRYSIIEPLTTVKPFKEGDRVILLDGDSKATEKKVR
ncbi:MAG: hypothetical protein J0L75_04250 [Spirochaetes bacterium]|nr:hypothetical protein [Spirochaetota bacterium]